MERCIIYSAPPVQHFLHRWRGVVRKVPIFETTFAVFSSSLIKMNGDPMTGRTGQYLLPKSAIFASKVITYTVRFSAQVSLNMQAIIVDFEGAGALQCEHMCGEQSEQSDPKLFCPSPNRDFKPRDALLFWPTWERRLQDAHLLSLPASLPHEKRFVRSLYFTL